METLRNLQSPPVSDPHSISGVGSSPSICTPCPLPSSLQRLQPLSSYLNRLGRVLSSSCSASDREIQDTKHLILACPASDSRTTVGSSPLSICVLGRGGLPVCLVTVPLLHATISKKGSGNSHRHALFSATLPTCSRTRRGCELNYRLFNHDDRKNDALNHLAMLPTSETYRFN